MTARRGHGEGSIYQRPDGRWASILDLGWQNGKRARKYFYGKSRKEVSDKLARALGALKNGIAPADQRTTLGAWVKRHLDNAAAADEIGHETLVRYRGILANYLEGALGKKRLAQLTPQDVQDYQLALIEHGMAPSTITLHRGLLSRALNEAVRFGLISRNVVALVRAPKRPTDHEAVGRSLSAEHARALLDHARSDTLWVFYVLLLTGGLRRGEALGLAWEDVELPSPSQRTAVLHIRRQLQWPNGTPTRVQLKSRSSDRRVPIPSVAVEALRERQDAQRSEFAALGRRWSASDLVLTTPAGAPVHRNTIVKRFHSHLRAASLPHYRPHDLRHTYGSLLMSQGVPLKTISELMGHASIEVTADIYLHSLEGQVLDTAQALERALALPLPVPGDRSVCDACGRPF